MKHATTNPKELRVMTRKVNLQHAVPFARTAVRTADAWQPPPDVILRIKVESRPAAARALNVRPLRVFVAHTDVEAVRLAPCEHQRGRKSVVASP